MLGWTLVGNNNHGLQYRINVLSMSSKHVEGNIMSKLQIYMGFGLCCIIISRAALEKN